MFETIVGTVIGGLVFFWILGKISDKGKKDE